MCFLFPLTAFADGKIASIKETQKAPFTGFLFDATAFAKIEADKQTLIEKYELEKKLLVEKCAAEKDFLNKNLDESINFKKLREDYFDLPWRKE